jgi:hypothetical protein
VAVSSAWWQRWPRNTYIIVLTVVLALVAAMVLYTYVSFREAAIDLILDRDQQLIVLSAARLRDELVNLADNLKSLALNKELSDGGLEDQRLALQAASPRLAVYDAGVVLLDHRGIVLASEPERAEITGEDWSDRAYFREILTDTHLYISDAVMDGSEDSMVVVLSIPIVGEQNQFTGVLVGMFHLGEETLSSFYASIVRLRVGQSGGTFVVDGNGLILFDTESNLIGQEVTTDQWEMITNGVNPGVALTKDNTGHQVVAAHASVPGTTWTLFTEDDWDILTSSTRRYSRILIFSFAAALVLPPLGLTIFSRLKRFPIVGDQRSISEGIISKQLKPVYFPEHLPMLPGWNLSQRIARADKDDGAFLLTWIQSDGRLMVAMGQVEDRGISGALRLASTRSCLRIAGLRGLEPDQALGYCNEVLCSEQVDISGVHCLFLMLDPRSGKMKFANAGVPEPLLVGDFTQLLTLPAGPPMGIDLQAKYPKGETMIESGKSLVMMSTELHEALVKDSDVFQVDPMLFYQEQEPRRAEVLADAILSKYQDVVVNGHHPMQTLHIFILERIRTGVGDEGDT